MSPRFRLQTRLLAQELHWRFGWPGAVGILALLTALALHHLTQRQEQLLQTLRQDGRLAQQRADRRGNDLLLPVAMPKADAMLLPRPQIPKVLNELQRLASLLQFELPQATYALLPSTDSAPSIYEITVPLKVRYPIIRLYLTMALNSIPSLAIRELNIKRSAPEQTELDVSVRFALFLQEDLHHNGRDILPANIQRSSGEATQWR